MRHLSVDYLSARSIHNDLPKHRTSNEIPRYGTRYGGTVTEHPVHCNTMIETVSKLLHFVFYLHVFVFFPLRTLPFSCVSIPAGFYFSVFVNGFIIFPLTDISVSVITLTVITTVMSSSELQLYTAGHSHVIT